MLMLVHFLIATVIIKTSLVKASEGDFAPIFRTCVTQCADSGCAQAAHIQGSCEIACPLHNRLPVPLPLRLAFWSCADDCRYTCMIIIEGAKRSGSLQDEHRPGGAYRVVKYNGKWPFKRVLGAQARAAARILHAQRLPCAACAAHPDLNN